MLGQIFSDIGSINRLLVNSEPAQITVCDFLEKQTGKDRAIITGYKFSNKKPRIIRHVHYFNWSKEHRPLSFFGDRYGIVRISRDQRLLYENTRIEDMYLHGELTGAVRKYALAEHSTFYF